jgi:hypothetical protein
MNTKFLFETLKGRNHSKGSCVDGRIILEWILGKKVGKMWTGLIWFTIVTLGGLLLTR